MNPLDFLLKEYEGLGEAFEHTRSARSDALRNYFLMLAALPVLFGLIAEQDAVDLLRLREHSRAFLFGFAGASGLAASIIGALMLVEIVGLRHEEILYIRSINAIRKRVVDESKKLQTDPSLESFLVLPYAHNVPPFNENFYRPAMIVSYFITGINTGLSYFGCAFLLTALRGGRDSDITPAWSDCKVLALTMLTFALHLFMLIGLGWLRERYWVPPAPDKDRWNW